MGFSRNNRVLRHFKGEIVNNLANLSDLDKQLLQDIEKLEEIKDDSSYSQDYNNRIWERIDKEKTERKGRLEALSINRKKFPSQVSRIKETIIKILDSDTSLDEKLRTLFREQGITLAAILTIIGMIISTTVLSLTGGAGGTSPQKDKNKLVEWVKDKLKCWSDSLKYWEGKAVGTLPGIFGSVFEAVLNFLDKAAGFAATHVSVLLTLVVGAA